MKHLSKTARICCLLFIALIWPSCSSHNTRSTEQQRLGLLAVSAARQELGLVETAQSLSYQRYLIDRLREAMQTERSFRVHVVKSSEAFAYHGGAGEILISLSLILRLRNEAELAFILAHEMGHDIRGHSPEAHDLQRMELEREADAFAMGAIALAGYDPRVALTGILAAYRGRALQADSHPDINLRLQYLQEYFLKSGWLPPGSLNVRNFRKYQELLLQQARQKA